MNQTILSGRVTRDIELSTTSSGKTFCRFSLAVTRRFKDANGEPVTDFHNIVAWNKTAEIVAKYAKKGRELIVRGELQNRSYETQDGTKRYVTEIIADEIQLVGARPENTQKDDYGEPTPPPEKYADMTPIEDESLPF